MHEPFDRLADDEDEKCERQGDERGYPLPDAARNPQRRYEPDRSRGREPVDDVMLAALENRPAAEESDTGDDPLNGPADGIDMFDLPRSRPDSGRPLEIAIG